MSLQTVLDRIEREEREAQMKDCPVDEALSRIDDIASSQHHYHLNYKNDRKKKKLKETVQETKETFNDFALTISGKKPKQKNDPNDPFNAKNKTSRWSLGAIFNTFIDYGLILGVGVCAFKIADILWLPYLSSPMDIIGGIAVVIMSIIIAVRA